MEKILARILLCLVGALLPLAVLAREPVLRADTSAAAPARRFVSAAALEFRGGRLFPTNDFFAGRNQAGKAMRHYAACHLKYAFAAPPGSAADRLYGGAYQGAGLALYSFGNRGELGTPFVAYLFQGARIVRLASFLSFDYEWKSAQSRRFLQESKFPILSSAKSNLSFLASAPHRRWFSIIYPHPNSPVVLNLASFFISDRGVDAFSREFQNETNGVKVGTVAAAAE